VRNEILKYAIEEADLDDNPDTRDNVIVYSDRNKSKFEIVKNEVKKFLTEYNIKMPTNTQEGNLTVSH
jgi:hypothetical protein